MCVDLGIGPHALFGDEEIAAAVGTEMLTVYADRKKAERRQQRTNDIGARATKGKKGRRRWRRR